MSPAEFLERFGYLADAPNGVAKLRELILQLAVRGKLVPQESNRTSSQELFKAVQTEKEQLKRKRKIKHLSSLSATDPGDLPFALPDGWELDRLGEIAIVERGGSPRPIKDFLTDDANGLNWIKISDSDIGGKYITSAKEKIRPEGLAKSRMVFPGDFLLTNSMSFGRPYITQIEGCIHDGWLRISPPEWLAKDYLYALLSSKYVRDFFIESAAGAVVMNLNSDKVRELPVPIPPLVEQHRIVAKVNQLMALCDELEAQQQRHADTRSRALRAAHHPLTQPTDAAEFGTAWHRLRAHFDALHATSDTVKTLRQTILQLAVQGKLVPQDPNDEPASALLEKIKAAKDRMVAEGAIKSTKPLPPINADEVPFTWSKEWECVPLDWIAIIGTGTTPSKGRADYYDGNIPWITSSATSAEVIDHAEFFITQIARSECRLQMYPPGTLIVALYGQGKTRGQISELGISATINQACAAVGFVDGFEALRPFVKLSLLKQYDEMRRTAAGGAQPNLNVLKIRQRPIPLPPISEQSRIVAKVDQLMALCDELESNLQAHDKTAERFAEAIVAELAA
jgi:type I restriction enzyme S subunit